MVTRVFLGRNGSNVFMGVSKPGVDVFSASAKDQLWRTDIEVLRYGMQGTVRILGNSSSYIQLGKSYSRTPMIFVGMLMPSGALRGPCRDFRVQFNLGESRFQIQNREGSAKTFYYLVYDNNVGQESFKSVQKNNGDWVFE